MAYMGIYEPNSRAGKLIIFYNPIINFLFSLSKRSEKYAVGEIWRVEVKYCV